METTAPDPTTVPLRASTLAPGIAVVAGVLWLVATGASWVGAVDDGGTWEYAAYALSLIGATVATLFTVGRAVPPRRSAVVVVAWVLLGIGLLGVALVAWALPFWAAWLALGCATLAWASQPHRAALLTLAGAQVAGIVALVVASEARVGDVDEYGDHPLAWPIGIGVTALLTGVGLWLLVRRSAPRAG
jgi:hypothetical protein